MQVKHLIEILEEYDPELPIMAACEGYGNVLNLSRKDIRIDEYVEGYGDSIRAVVSIVAQRS